MQSLRVSAPKCQVVTSRLPTVCGSSPLVLEVVAANTVAEVPVRASRDVLVPHEPCVASPGRASVGTITVAIAAAGGTTATAATGVGCRRVGVGTRGSWSTNVSETFVGACKLDQQVEVECSNPFGAWIGGSHARRQLCTPPKQIQIARGLHFGIQFTPSSPATCGDCR